MAEIETLGSVDLGAQFYGRKEKETEKEGWGGTGGEREREGRDTKESKARERRLNLLDTLNGVSLVVHLKIHEQSNQGVAKDQKQKTKILHTMVPR